MSEGFKSLNEVFNKEPSLGKIREVVKSSDVINDFYKIFPDFDKIAIPQKTIKTTLIIKVENPTWRNELKFRESEIIQKINNHYKEERINKLRFTG